MAANWFSFGACSCEAHTVMDIRIEERTVDLAPKCPLCGEILRFRAFWPATSAGFGGSSDELEDSPDDPIETEMNESGLPSLFCSLVCKLACDNAHINDLLNLWYEAPIGDAEQRQAIEFDLYRAVSEIEGIDSILTFAAEEAGDGGTKAVAWLTRLLHHRSPVVREGAVYGLAKIAAHNPAVRLMLKNHKDESPGVQAAIDGLYFGGSP